MYPLPIQNLIKALEKLPSVGKRTAERYVFYLLKSGKKDVAELILALQNLSDNIKSCQVCWDFSDRTPCKLCSDSKRNHSIICVVAESQNVQIMERIKKYTGLYHVLRGTIKTDNPEDINKLKINELLKRIQNKQVNEILLALNPDLNGEATMMFLKSKIKEINPAIHVTRLARGLPMGSDMMYADDITLDGAFNNRTEN